MSKQKSRVSMVEGMLNILKIAFVLVFMLQMLFALMGCNVISISEVAKPEVWYESAEEQNNVSKENEETILHSKEEAEDEPDLLKNYAEPPKNEADAYAIAMEFGCAAYGASFSSFIYEKCEKYSTGWLFYFEIQYKGFITGPKLQILVNLDGTATWNVLTEKSYLDFDVSLLDQITKQYILEWTNQKIENTYGSILKNHSVDKIWIDCEDEQYQLVITGIVYTKESEVSGSHWPYYDFAYEYKLS